MDKVQIARTGSGRSSFAHSRRFHEDDIRAEIELLTLNSVATNTKISYNNSLRIFSSFRKDYGFSDIWGPPVSHLCVFIAHMSLKGLAYSTISSYLAGISFKCKLLCTNDCTKYFLVRKLLEGVKRSRKSIDQRLPITQDILKKLISSSSFVCSSNFETFLFCAAFSLAYHAFLRVGEFTRNNANNIHHIIGIKDIQIINDQSINRKLLKLTVPFSKTDQSGKGSSIQLVESDTQAICPILLLLRYLSVRPNIGGQLFIHMDGSPLTRYQFTSVLNKSIDIIGLSSSLYTSHSFRIGAASDSFLKGHSESEIMKKGRWSSNAYKSYIRI